MSKSRLEQFPLHYELSDSMLGMLEGMIYSQMTYVKTKKFKLRLPKISLFYFSMIFLLTGLFVVSIMTTIIIIRSII